MARAARGHEQALATPKETATERLLSAAYETFAWAGPMALARSVQRSPYPGICRHAMAGSISNDHSVPA